MNKEQLIEQGLKIAKISELSQLGREYEDWKAEVLQYAKNVGLTLESVKCCFI